MAELHPSSEEDRAVAVVAACERQLRRGQENALSASEVLRRAMRHLEESEFALGEATRRLDRVRSARPRSKGGATDRFGRPAGAPSEWATGEVLDHPQAAIDLSRAGALELSDKITALRERAPGPAQLE